MGSGSKKSSRKPTKVSEDSPVRSELSSKPMDGANSDVEEGQHSAASDSEQENPLARDSSEQGRPSARDSGAEGNNKGEDSGVVPMEVDKPTPQEPSGGATLSLSGNVHPAGQVLGGTPLVATNTGPDVERLETLTQEVEQLKQLISKAGVPLDGSFFQNSMLKSMQRSADEATFNGDGTDEDAHKRIRDFLDRHFLFLDNSTDNADQRYGRKCVEYLKGFLEGTAKAWFKSLTFADEPSDGIVAKLNQLACDNYATFLSGFNRLTGELRWQYSQREWRGYGAGPSHIQDMPPYK
ncbi:hypothetical protein DFS34DRAFT_683732 [Phlyctochytrium arcticum]|nr:hypothetical protein DFS34DRAFT_683732 [Phlyctochytrium arcticum]